MSDKQLRVSDKASLAGNKGLPALNKALLIRNKDF